MSKTDVLEMDFEDINSKGDRLLDSMKASISTGIDFKSTQYREKPTETLNTRIPKSLSDRIDDYLYQSKKSGSPETKQSLTIRAIAGFLNQNRFTTSD